MVQADPADVVVAGAGSAGVAAACAAAESGAHTILIESSGHVGGTLAWQLLEHSAGFHDVAGNQVIAGFGQRVIDRLAEYGGTPGHIRDDVGYTATRAPVNHAELALAEATLLGDARVEIWLDSAVVRASRASGRVTQLRVRTPTGQRAVLPSVIVDCTGDSALAAMAGARSHSDADDRRQPASLLFKLGGVDCAALLAYARAHPADFREGSHIGEADAEHVNLWGFGALLADGHAEGLLKLVRKEMHLAGWPRRGEAVINVTRVPAGRPDGDWTADAFVALSRQVLELARWFRLRVPGCRNSYVAAVADRVGVRESRRIVGEYTLTQADVLSAARFDDAVARAAFPIDIHAADQPTLSHTEQFSHAYDIPYRCLVAAGVDNVLVAGRCISTTHEANGSARITATCFATGEAAGLAAALVARTGSAARDLDYGHLRQYLRSRGALLD
jgi:2-polyprenyl-6-methoxyphenol hydroxylase-like FAD-dependent oxidoreductase